MKVLPEVPPAEFEAPPTNAFTLPQGLIGFPQHTRAELFYIPDRLPFLWLKLHGGADSVQFVVLEPGGFVPGYEPELFDADAASLGLSNPADAMVLTIVTLQSQNPLEATVNLVGPIVVNRGTRVGRQLVISNYSRYSARHPLVEPAETAACNLAGVA